MTNLHTEIFTTQRCIVTEGNRYRFFNSVGALLVSLMGETWRELSTEPVDKRRVSFEAQLNPQNEVDNVVVQQTTGKIIAENYFLSLPLSLFFPLCSTLIFAGYCRALIALKFTDTRSVQKSILTHMN